MINAKIHAELADNAGLIIEFSDGKGEYKDHPAFFTPVRDRTDLLKRLYFKNRMYICDTLNSFLNQRLHALPDCKVKIEILQVQIDRGRNYTYEELCQLVANKMKDFNSIAPGEKSRFNNHFKTVIIPILTECDNVRTGKAKVHYC